MSKIDKLAILGIRSFDNIRSETIQFNSPLTLIVGYNGSGKTTIIECLKYATTGEMPPNSRGGAFIHDPNLCGEKEVLAQVKMSFFPATGTRMVITRSLQLTVKKTTRSLKTLEGQLLMQKDGERTAISTRVAELDQIMPQYLGVSKAVLESVIFCHQDESLWPMSEPSALKKRFDEIFEAQKYTKAIDNIKQLRKKQNEELGKFKIIEQYSKEEKDKADKAEKKSRQLSDDIEELRKQQESLNEKAKEAMGKAEEAWNLVARYAEDVETLKVSRKNYEWHESKISKLKETLVERPESDDWLANELSQYEDRVRDQEERQKNVIKRYEEIEDSIKDKRKQQSEKRVEAGKYEQQEATHEEKIKYREEEIKRSAREHNIRGFDTELDDMQINEFLERIQKLSKEQNARVDRLRKENANEAQKVQDILDKLREQRSAFQESKKSSRENITTNDQKMASLRSEMSNISSDEAEKANLEAKIDELDEKLTKAREQASASNVEAETKNLNQKLTKLEDEGSALSRELFDATKQAGDLARLDHLKKEAKDRQRSLETMKNAHGSQIEQLLGGQWQANSLESDFQRILDEKKRKVTEAEKQRDGVNRELEQTDFKLKSLRADLKAKEKEKEDCASLIREKTQGEPDEYPENLSGAETDRDIRKGDVEGSSHLMKYFQDCLEAAKGKQSACRLCTRQFADDRSKRNFVSRLEDMLSKVDPARAKADLESLEEELSTIREASSSYDTWVRLSEKEIPAIQGEISKLDSKRETVLRQVEDQDSVVASLEEARQDADAFSKTVSTIVKYNTELKSFVSQIGELSRNPKDGSEARTLEDIKEDIDSVNTKARETRDRLAKAQAEHQQNRDRMSAIEIELSDARNKLTTATHELEKTKGLADQIKNLKDSNQQLKDSISKLDQQLEDLGPKFLEEQARLDDVRSRGETREHDLQREATGLTDTVRTLTRAHADVRSYIEEGGASRLQQCRREISSFDDQIASLESEQKTVTQEANKIREELSNQDKTKRELSDNIEYRTMSRDMTALQKKIEELSSQNAEADQAHHRTIAERHQNQATRLYAEEQQITGEMKAKDGQLMHLLEDWNSEYKDAAAKYKRARIDVETTRAVVDDLGKYGAALDKAIMKYHSLKMEEINRLIEELWKRTYQGTDVDAISIRSDAETARGNRSYNYRVCMLKQDAEMDMRGRCSAGQKVLASIIIRLALAECFGVNCGIIALDEPTTNLDRDNIRSLAESLHELIKHRRQQKNFQLIVITHDEDFLRAMRCADFCDTYYRVSRSDRQKSIIERQTISEVM